MIDPASPAMREDPGMGILPPNLARKKVPIGALDAGAPLELDATVKDSLERDPSNRWVGEFIVRFVKNRGNVMEPRYVLQFQCVLALRPRIRGEGIMGGFEFGSSDMLLDGGRIGQWMEFTIRQFRHQRVKRLVFLCSGMLEANDHRMEGGFNFSCYSSNCDCGGGDGTFWLQREEQPRYYRSTKD